MNEQQPSPPLVAAIDLGSNSFHMIVAKVIDGHLQVVDKLKEMVRLASGLDDKNALTGDAWLRALSCLERFGERLKSMPTENVRVVGTNTLRKARNSAQFIAAAEVALGHSIEIISGVEEARLIYLGVSHSVADMTGKSIVMDIGGGSTELIIGERFQPLHLESLYMGCVSMSQRFFADGVIKASRMQRAEIATKLELKPVEAHYQRIGWETVLGASGTIRAVRSVIQSEGWGNGHDGISLKGLYQLKQALIDIGQVDQLSLKGLRAERAPVFVGGVAILLAVFEGLGFQYMSVSDGALREGLLYDLIGRIQHEDVREKTVLALSQRYQIDTAQAERVDKVAHYCWLQVAEKWELTNDYWLHLLSWAARLHEIGLAIAHSQYYRHSAYLLAHMDMPGFSQRDQRLLSALVCVHRRKFSLERCDDFNEETIDTLSKLAIILRLAVLLQRSHAAEDMPDFTLKARKKSLQITFNKDWLLDHPLAQVDLEQEAAYLSAVNFKLTFV